MEKKKLTKSNIYMITGIVVLLLAIAGSAYAYYSASATKEIVGTAAGAGLELTIEKLSTSANDALIPLDNDINTLTKAAKGYGNSTNNFDASKSCIDKNGYTVCQVYKITISNTSSIPIIINGGVTLYGPNTPNIECTKMVNSTSVTDNTSCKGNNTLANNYTLNAGSSNDYYVIVYIKNIDEEQTDVGGFNGIVTFTSTNGGMLKAKFTEDNLVKYITNLYNNASKTTVVNNTIEYNQAPEVSLMNDRLGGTTSDYNAGNIRYYGASPNNYIDIGDYHKNENYDACYEDVNNELSSYGYTYDTSKDFCNSTVKGYNLLFGAKNIDECVSSFNCNNWEEKGFESEETCNNEISNVLKILNANNATEACGTNVKAYLMFNKTNKEECISYLNCSNWKENDFTSEEECNNNLNSLLKAFNTDDISVACDSDVKGYMLRFDSPEACYENYKCDESTTTLYRIIGVFKDVTLSNGTKKNLVKVVRDESIGNYSWDTSLSDVNDGRGINQWGPSDSYKGADLMKLLNPGYENELVGGSLYYNSSSGTCYNGKNNATTTCNFGGIGLSDNVKNNISEVIWKLGMVYNDQWVSIYPDNAYLSERDIQVRTNPGDGITRTTTWSGKVALMYLSDYGYATDFKQCNEDLDDYGTSACKESNWLNKGDSQWLLTPHSHLDTSVWEFNEYGGYGFNMYALNDISVHPTFYLKDDVVIESGTGTIDDPYKLGY